MSEKTMRHIMGPHSNFRISSTDNRVASTGYVDDLMKTLVDVVSDANFDEDLSELVEPAPLNATFVKPDKAEAVQAHVSRFLTRV